MGVQQEFSKKRYFKQLKVLTASSCKTELLYNAQFSRMLIQGYILKYLCGIPFHAVVVFGLEHSFFLDQPQQIVTVQLHNYYYPEIYFFVFFRIPTQVVSINRAKEEIAEYGLGFMVHDKQIRPLCGPINTQDEQLFGYEVTVYRK